MGGRFRRIQVSFRSHFRLSSMYHDSRFERLIFRSWALGEYSRCCSICPRSLGKLDDIHWGSPSLYRLSVLSRWVSLIFFSGSTTSDSHILSPVIRTKALLFTLIRAFEIDLAVSAKDIGTKAFNQRPILTNNSNQMPLLVRPVASNL